MFVCSDCNLVVENATVGVILRCMLLLHLHLCLTPEEQSESSQWLRGKQAQTNSRDSLALTFSLSFSRFTLYFVVSSAVKAFASKKHLVDLTAQ